MEKTTVGEFCLKYFMPTNIHTLQINNVHS